LSLYFACVLLPLFANGPIYAVLYPILLGPCPYILRVFCYDCLLTVLSMLYCILYYWALYLYFACVLLRLFANGSVYALVYPVVLGSCPLVLRVVVSVCRRSKLSASVIMVMDHCSYYISIVMAATNFQVGCLIFYTIFQGIMIIMPAGESMFLNVTFEVFTAVTMKNGVFCNVTPFSYCKNRCFGGT
jgi:hypothetical protein